MEKMKMKMKILISDDKPEQAEITEREIASWDGSVTTLASDDLKQALSTFFRDSVSSVLGGNAGVDSEFDGYDVLIVDNNLTELKLEGARLTAETIMGYLRAFTNTPYIISLNKNPHVDFDLKDLFGDYESLADLALNTRHLSNRRLLEGNSEEKFAPWYWPQLADAAARRRKQIEFVEENFETSVWDALNFPIEAEEYLSLGAKSPLSSNKNNVREASFEVFFDSSQALPLADKERLEELAAEQVDLAKRAIHRISAYEVDRWLRCDVLGVQDVLIDLPHLLAQMPFLLGNNAQNLNCWNSVLTSKEPPFGLDQQLFEEHLIPARFEYDMWLPGPCFWWPTLKSDDILAKLFFDAEGDWPDAVFCEDVSCFVISFENENPPQEFEAEIEGSWIRRHVANLQGHFYSPRSRILGSAS